MGKDRKTATTPPPSENTNPPVAPIESPPTEPRVQRPRRGRRSAAQVMQLRPRSSPNESTSSNSANGRSRRDMGVEPASNEMPSPKRIQYGRLSKGPLPLTPGDTGRSCSEEPRDFEAMEDRILLRSMESYGDDFYFIQDNVLPIYGGDRQKTLVQLRERCRTLLRKSKPTMGKSKAARIRRDWFAEAEGAS